MKVITYSLILILMFSILSGCWDRRELDELAIGVAVGIDKAGDHYRLSAQIVDPSQVATKTGGGGSHAPIITYSIEANSLLEAFRKMATLSPRRFYGAHLRMVVIGEEAAKDGLMKITDIFARHKEFRTDFFMVVAKGTSAENVVKILTPIETIPANSLYKSLVNAEGRWAPSIGIPFYQLVTDLTVDGRELVLTGITVVGDQKTGETNKNVEESTPKALLQYYGIALFKGDRLVGWLTPEESKGVTYIRNKVENTVAVIPCSEGDGKISLEIKNIKTKIKGTVKNGTPKIQVEIQNEAIIGGVQCTYDIMNRVTFNQIEMSAEKLLEKLITETIQKAQQFQTDVFGFGEVIYRKYPGYWEKNKQNWNEIFATLPFDVKVKASLKSTGIIENSYQISP